MFEIYRGDERQLKITVNRSAEDETDWLGSQVRVVFALHRVGGYLLGEVSRQAGVTIVSESSDQIIAIATIPRSITATLPDTISKIYYDIEVTAITGQKHTKQSFFTVLPDVG